MRILLAQRLPCFPAFTGEARLNRALLEGLAERGHPCRLIALATIREHPDAVNELRREIHHARPFVRPSPDGDVYTYGRVQVHVVADGYHLCTRLSEQIQQFDPDCVLISQDRSFLALATALSETDPARVVFLAHSQSTLPFGPESFRVDGAQAEILTRVGHIVSFSRYVADYISRWGGRSATMFAPPAYGKGPFPCLARHDDGAVTLVNPSQVKGVAIFEELARARPDLPFAAVPTWATTSADRERLGRLPNVRLLAPVENIDEILAGTRILLVPSLWGEAFGLIVVEAMLRGVPVLASNVGGLPEAKMGVDYVLPVSPIVRYCRETDERGLPVPVVPPQDVSPWLEALDRLTADSAHYYAVSEASRSAASTAVSGVDVRPFEDFLQRTSGRHSTPNPATDDFRRRRPSI